MRAKKSAENKPETTIGPLLWGGGSFSLFRDSGIIRPVVDRVFPFESTKEALAYVEKGRTKGKVIVKMLRGHMN